jgi:antitoxin VapB
MRERKLDAFVIGRHENIAWATAGRVDVRIGLLRETGPATLLFTANGARHYVTSNNEAERLAAEEFAGLPFEPLVYPWQANALAESLAGLGSNLRIAGDIPVAAAPALPLLELRGALTLQEIERYRSLGSAVAAAIEQIAFALEPGRTERQMQSMVSAALLPQGILPSVYLTSVDDRVRRYPHPVPRDGQIKEFAMLGLCARRWGLTVAITRFIHFGTPPAALMDAFGIVRQVAARLLQATTEGAVSAELFRVAQEAYAELGAPRAEQRHHQGGAIGYIEREWFARLGGTERIQARQAVAWNPSFGGAKYEDTVLYNEGHLELLTATPGLPYSTFNLNSNSLEFSNVLVR